MRFVYGRLAGNVSDEGEERLVSGIFISHRRLDADFAAELLEAEMAERFGRSLVFRDSRRFDVGADFDPSLWRRLLRSDVVIVVIGPHWLVGADGGQPIREPDDYVRRELVAALHHNVKVVPVLVDQSSLPAEADLPDDLRLLGRLQYMRLRSRAAAVDVAAIADAVENFISTATSGRWPISRNVIIGDNVIGDKVGPQNIQAPPGPDFDDE